MSAIGNPPRDSGFTLIESLVIVAIMAMVTGVALPKIQRWIALQDAQEKITGMHQQIARARARAIQTQSAQRVEIDRARIYFLPDGVAVGGPVRIETAKGPLLISVDPVTGSVRQSEPLNLVRP
jgi:Tfp pilus assembly protein FimT